MDLRSICSTVLLVFVALVGGSVSARAQCSEWGSGFALPGPNLEVYVLEVLDDGTGPALYVGGSFSKVDGLPANHVAKWNGSTWSALGDGLHIPVDALAAYDDGSGPAVYASGSIWSPEGITSEIAKWNGSTWSSVGTTISGSISALVVYDDGTGPALYVGGSFRSAGGTSGPFIARWNGSTWTSVGTGINGSILALKVWDDGSGLALYAGGYFITAGSGSAAGIAKWDGSNWLALDSGPSSVVIDIAIFDNGSGDSLYALGWEHIAKWDGSSWSLIPDDPLYYEAESIAVHDDGSGPSLYAFGFRYQVAKWDGSAWSTIDLSATDLCLWRPLRVHALASFDDGSGPSLYVGTSITSIPEPVRGIFLGKWHNATWSLVGNSHGVGGEVCGISALLPYEVGTKSLLIAGGDFATMGSQMANNIACWDGTAWTGLGDGVNGAVLALAVLDRGPGPELFAGGYFTLAGGHEASNIARWNGIDWESVGSGTNDDIRALAVFDDGSGPALFAAGTFTTAGGENASAIAKWDGSSWSSLGSGIDGEVNALTIFDDGGGPALYVGGYFTSAGGKGADNVARWNGSDWTPLGSGLGGGVNALTVFDDGTGPALFAGGRFNVPDGSGSSGLAKWSRTYWSDVAGFNISYYCYSLTVFDDGSGPALYVSDAYAAHSYGALYKWNGSTQVLVAGFHGQFPALSALTVAKVGTALNPDLYIGGNFLAAGTMSSVSIARLIGCGHPGVDFCYGDGSSTRCPCANEGSAGHGCENSHSTGGALLDTSGWTSLNFDSLRLTSSGELPNALSIFLQGNTEITPTFYGDGLRCAGGTLKRLFVKSAVWGVVSAPHQGDPTISARSAALGDPLSLGTSRIYQVYYRDPITTFCPEPLGSVWNASNAVRIGWLP